MSWNFTGARGFRTGTALTFSFFLTALVVSPVFASPAIPPRCAQDEEILFEGAAFGVAFVDTAQISSECEPNPCLCAQSDSLQILDNKIATFKAACHAWSGKPKVTGTPDWSLDEGIYFYAPGYRYSSTPHCIRSHSSGNQLSATALVSYICCRNKKTQLQKPPYVVFDRMEISCELLKGQNVHDAGIINTQRKIAESSRYSCNAAVDRLKSKAAQIKGIFEVECAKFNGSSVVEHLTPRHTICDYSGTPQHLYHARATLELRCCVPNSCIPAGQSFDYSSPSDMRRGCCGDTEPTVTNGQGECREPVKSPATSGVVPVKTKTIPPPNR